MIEVVMKVDDEFWDNITQLTVFKEKKEIIHCKDCKYWTPTTVESLKDGSYINQPNPCEINCIGNKGEWRTADDFCSRGERAE